MLLEKSVVVGKDSATIDSVRSISRQVFAADDLCDAWDTIPALSPQLIVLDPSISQENVNIFLSSRAQRSVFAPVVIVQNSSDADRKANFIMAGALDVLEPSDLGRLEHLLAQITSSQSCSNEIPAVQPDVTGPIIGTSDSTKKMLEMIRLVAKSRCNPVLIIGETGTGKEIAAREVHNIRHGKNAAFVGINCAALTANLLESELFGHVKGAFTGADRDKIGLLELAGSGTVLLDEISEMPLDLQAKLLRVLQEKTFRKVGGVKEITCSATIIASSNRNLYKEAQANRFRLDLYYRLSVCPISLLPLRSSQRSSDIPDLAQHFLKTSSICPEKTGKIAGFTKLAMESLQRYAWPGNIRELKNVIERAIILETTDKIGLSSLIFNPEEMSEERPQGTAIAADFSLDRAEKELISRALQESGYQKTRAAALLGITRATLYAKVKQYDIRMPASAPVPAMAEL